MVYIAINIHTKVELKTLVIVHGDTLCFFCWYFDMSMSGCHAEGGSIELKPCLTHIPIIIITLGPIALEWIVSIKLHVQWVTPFPIFVVHLYKNNFTTWALWLVVLSFLLLLRVKWHSRLTYRPFTKNIHISLVGHNMLCFWMMEHRVLTNMKGLWFVEYIPLATTCMWSDNSIQSLQWALVHSISLFALSTSRISSTLVWL